MFGTHSPDFQYEVSKKKKPLWDTIRTNTFRMTGRQTNAASTLTISSAVVHGLHHHIQRVRGTVPNLGFSQTRYSDNHPAHKPQDTLRHGPFYVQSPSMLATDLRRSAMGTAPRPARGPPRLCTENSTVHLRSRLMPGTQPDTARYTWSAPKRKSCHRASAASANPFDEEKRREPAGRRKAPRRS